MDRPLIIRNLITSILNENNEILFKTNLQFFYDIEDGILRDDQLNMYIKTRIKSADRNLIYNVFLNTYSGEDNILFFQNFNLKIDKYLSSDHNIADIEDIIFPIHSIFYRFFIKGGAALKVFVDNLETVGVIGRDIPYIPNIAIDPTDIDSNLIVNPSFPEVDELIVILKQVIKNVSLNMFKKYNAKYCKFSESLVKKIQRNDIFSQKLSSLFNKDIFITEPSMEETNRILANNGFSIKPQNSCMRFTLLNMPMQICVIRLLLCVDIHETQVVIHQTEKGEMGLPNTLFVSEAEAELIDITLYEQTNPKYNDIWKWAKQTLPYDRRHTLFQGIHDMIIDIIQMNTDAETSGNPSLIAKLEKRKMRLDYLYFLYCNYRLIQVILDNKNEINEKHIIQYCHKLVEEPFLELRLSKKQMNQILPYIIGKTTINMDRIIIDFIKNYIIVDQSLQYKLSNIEGVLVSSKLDKSVYTFIFPSSAIKTVEDYIITNIPTLSKKSATLLFIDLVEGYKTTYMEGNTLFIFMCAILDKVGSPIRQFVSSVITSYNDMIKSIKSIHNQLIQSNQYIQTMRKSQLPTNFQKVILRENIGRMCSQIIDNSEIWVDIIILDKYAPFKILCIPKIDVNILQVLESVFEIINKYLISLAAPYIILYELTPEYKIDVYFRFVFTKTINAINLKGDVDIHFCRFIIKYRVLPKNIVVLYENQGNTLYQSI